MRQNPKTEKPKAPDKIQGKPKKYGKLGDAVRERIKGNKISLEGTYLDGRYSSPRTFED